MKFIKYIVSVIFLTLGFSLALNSCKDPLGVEDNVKKNQFTTDTLITYVKVHDTTIVIKEIKTKDTLYIYKRDTIVMPSDTTVYKTQVKNIRIDWIEDYDVHGGPSYKEFPNYLTYSIKAKNARVDLTKNVPLIDLDLELENIAPKFNMPSLYRDKVIKNFKVLLKNYIPYGDRNYFNELTSKGYWAEAKLIDYQGVSDTYNCVSNIFYVQSLDCKANSVSMIIYGEFDDNKYGQYYSVVFITLEF